ARRGRGPRLRVGAALDPASWTNWFLATAGIGATLAGLVFVAFSINLREILKYGGVVERGGEALLLLLSVAIVAIVGLWPADRTWLGIGLVVLGVVAWAAVVAIFVSTGRTEQATTPQKASRVALGQAATIPVAL